jgi:hypothetical protein
MKMLQNRGSAAAYPHGALGATPTPAASRQRGLGELSASLLMNLVAAKPASAPPPVAALHSSRDMLETLIRAAVIPGLALRHVPDYVPDRPRALTPHPRTEELARLLVARDPGAALMMIRGQVAPGRSILPLYAALFEPAARALGDLWRQDVCSELDVTIGLSRLQTAIRVLGAQPMDAGAVEAFPVTAGHPAVLVVPEPGELHVLGAALDTDTLNRAGWAPHSEFPATDKALQDLLHTTWYDALDLSLSAVFNREHWLPRVGETIQRARRASLNPSLLVVVGGRVFTEQSDAATTVGADAFSVTALQVRQLIQRGLSRAPTHGRNW